MTDEEQKNDQNVDALRALEGGQEAADALAAMAGGGSSARAPAASGEAAPGGQDADASGQDDESDHVLDDQAAALAAAAMGPVDAAAELAAAASGAGDDDGLGPQAPAFEGAGAPPSAQDKRARAARFQAQSRRVYAYQFKRTMIPLLIVVGVLLLVIGIISAAYLPSGDGGDTSADPNATEAPSHNPVGARYRPYLVLSAFVVGAILLVGAWMFYADVRRSDKKQAAMLARDQEQQDQLSSRPEQPS